MSQSVSGVFNTTGDDAGSVAVTVTNTVSQTHQQSNPEAPIIVVGADDTVDVEVSGYFNFKIFRIKWLVVLCSPVSVWDSGC